MIMIFGFVKPRYHSLTTITSNRKRCCSSNSLPCKKEKRYSFEVLSLKTPAKNKPVVLHSTSSNVQEKKDEKNFPNDGAPLTKKGKCRKNALNIQMLSESLHRQIFKDQPSFQASSNPELIEKAKARLKKHGLWKDDIEYIRDVSLDLPPLRGKNIEEHFEIIGEEQAKPYRDLVLSFIKNGLPTPPSEWLCQKGWTKYVEGKEPVSVPFPDDDIFVFDVEVNVKLGQLPTLATAVSSSAWYGWICSDLAEKVDSIPKNRYTTNMLIPFEGKGVNKERPRVIIGHNVSYDRARIREQYYFKNSALRFLDTMSLHICIGGISKSQKTILKKKNSELENNLEKELCLCSLTELYNLYCNKELTKDPRKIFVEGLMPEVRENFQSVMSYCSTDVKATYEVLQAIFPTFLSRFSHPVTFAGMLEMGSGILCLNSNWNKFLSEVEQTYEDINSELHSILSKKCENACKLFHNEQYKKDLWMWSEDWSTQELKLTKKKLKQKSCTNETENIEKSQNEKEEEEELKQENELKSKFEYLFNLKKLLPKNLPFLSGYPLWYRKLCRNPDSLNWSPQLSPSMIVTPKLLNLTWENFPLFHIQQYGWGILIPNVFAENVSTSAPFQTLKELTIKNCNLDLNNLTNIINKRKVKTSIGVPYYNGTAIWCNHVIDDCCYFLKLPHKNGSSNNVGNPLSIELSHAFNNGILSTEDYDAAKVIDLWQKLTYWRNSRQRILGQMVVWLNKKETSFIHGSDEDYNDIGIIVPLTVVCGTLTRRAMESTWLVASKTTQNRIGSELRSMVQAPPGYHFVGADVDSQELWIASLIGDSHYAKEHGCTPIGWMTLSGTKSNGSDMHSVVAKEVGISRDHAKIINYARIYGAGVQLAQKLLKNANPTLSEEEAMEKAKKMYSFTKGKKEYRVKRSTWHGLTDQRINFYDLSSAAGLAKRLRKKIEDVFEKPRWVNGTESDVFNQLEKIARSREPVTPFLQGRLTRALEPRFEGDDLLLNTRINWVVQSGAVDFLHLLLVCMKWLTKGEARYCFSFHDEVRYLSPSEDRYNVALALHVSNLLVRCFCSHRLGIYDLPQSVAFFSAVEVDKSLRKEASDDCVTPSNPHGLEKGYGIPPGESLNIYKTIQKSEGNLSKFRIGKKKASSFSSQSSPKIEALKTGMSKATKRKYVCREILEGELVPLRENQQIVKVLGSKGSNLHEVETPDSTTFLVSMPNKFRKNVWIKRGDYVLVEPIEEGGKVKAEIVNILTLDYIKYLKKENIWPLQFSNSVEVTGSVHTNDNLLKKNNSNRKTVDSLGESENSELT